MRKTIATWLYKLAFKLYPTPAAPVMHVVYKESQAVRVRVGKRIYTNEDGHHKVFMEHVIEDVLKGVRPLIKTTVTMVEPNLFDIEAEVSIYKH